MGTTLTVEVRKYACGYGVYCIEDQCFLDFDFDRYSEQTCGTYDEAEHALYLRIHNRRAYKNSNGISYKKKESD